MPGTLIKRIREARNITQEEVARQMGISQNAYSKIENNITQLTVNHVKLISTALNVSPIELLSDDFEIHKPLSVQAETITRQALMERLDGLKELLQSKQMEKSDLYPILFYQLQMAEHILVHVD